MNSDHLSVGGHNTYILVLVVALVYWTYRVGYAVYEALRVLVILQPETEEVGSREDSVLSRLGLRRPRESSVLVLGGVNELVDEFKILTRRHIEQIIAASADLRHPPQTPVIKHLHSHINVETISGQDPRNAVSFTVDTTRKCAVFACLNLPLKTIELEAGRAAVVGESEGGPTETRLWWRDVVWTSIFPFTKRRLQFSGAGEGGAGQRPIHPLSPLRALAATGQRISPPHGGVGFGLAVTIAPSSIRSASEGGEVVVPLLLGVASMADGEGGWGSMELTLCKLSTEGRIEVLKQVVITSEGGNAGIVAISGLYGLEENHTNECMICCDERINTALLPCCHCALCQNCAPNLRDGRCPICRVAYTGYVSLPFRTPPPLSGVLSPLLSSPPR
jgi:hypothetical protein